MESTLALKKSDFEAEVGHYLGYGRDTTLWDAYQLGDIKSCINSGYRRFLYAASPEPYDWSFLHPKRAFTLASGDSTINLPDDFGGVEGRITITSSTSSYWPIPVVGSGTVQARHAIDTSSSGPPEIAAEQPVKGTAHTHGQRFQLYVFPTANADYTLTFQYFLHADALTDKSPYAYGGPEHHETILESCLAIAEQRLDNQEGLHTANFKTLLAASMGMDRRRKPQLLGYNRDRSDDYYPVRGGRSLDADLVTFNGTLWD